MDPLATTVHVVLGVAALGFGRRLFWLFVGAAGFLVAFALVSAAMPDRASWLAWVLALAAGAVGALVAVGLQYAAAGLAGFAAGAYAALPLAATWGASPWIVLLGGLVGALAMGLLFDPALIALSALLGARALVAVSGLEGRAALGLGAVLVVVGIAVQAAAFAPASPPPRRRRLGTGP